MNIGPTDNIGAGFHNIQRTADVKPQVQTNQTQTPAKADTSAQTSAQKDSVKMSGQDRNSSSYFNKMLSNRDLASNIMADVSSSVASTATFVKLLENAVKNAVNSIYSLLKKMKDEYSDVDEPEQLYLTELLMKLETQFTYQHSCRVTELSTALAERMGSDPELMKELKDGAKFKELGQAAISFTMRSDEEQSAVMSFLGDQLKAFREAGELHDIGKIQIPASILNKREKLNEVEYEIMKQHPVIGEALLRPIISMAHVLPTVRHHHERWDGKGYPDGLSGADIPLSARIVTVTDSFDAMISERPYKKAMTVREAVNELIQHSGTQFAPDIAATFVSLLRERGDLEKETEPKNGNKRKRSSLSRAPFKS